MSSLSPYGDVPLSEGSIRLLRILPHTDEHSQIQCRLSIYPVLDSGSIHPYEALSYVWGSEDEKQSILLDHHEFPVHTNLHAALLRLRDKFLERIVWIDAICINQQNNSEKGQQVQSMAKIYTQASRVIVWLGEAAADSFQALEDIRQATDAQSPKSNNEQAILLLLQRPWFERIWVLQEVAAARHVLIKCGPTEIDGHAFCSGLSALRLSYDTCPGLQALISSVTYLISGAIFRPRHFQPGRFSLDICPMAELVGMYCTRKASVLHDKVYALLGMSSDPRDARLSINYDMPWGQLLKQLIKVCVSEQVSVDAWDDKEMVVIKGKGYVLGEVVSVERGISRDDRQSVSVTWNHSYGYRDLTEGWSSCWTCQVTAKTIQEGDIICLLQGAVTHTIVRLCDDYWTVIRFAGSTTDDLRVTSADIKWSELTAYFLLVWDWDTYLDKLQDAEDYEWYKRNRGLKCSRTEWKDFVDTATRLQNVGMVLQDTGKYQEAKKKLKRAHEVFEKALRSMSSQRSTCEGHSHGKGDVEKLEVVTGLLIRGTWPPLCLAAEGGHEAVVKLLLNSGKINPDAEDEDGQTPLSWAARNGHDAVVKLLLNSGKVNLDAEVEDGQTPLSWAARNGHEAIVKLLLNSGKVNPDAEHDGRTPLSWAATNGDEAVVKLLLDSGKVNLDPRKKRYRQVPLLYAAENGHEAVVKLLLGSDKVNPDAEDVNYGGISLLHAAMNGHNAVVKLLLDSGKVDLDDTDTFYERKPLLYAANNGHDAVVKLLLDSGKFDLDTRDKTGQAALLYAVKNRHDAVVKLLLDSSKVNLDGKDKDYGKMLLLSAAENGYDTVVKLLLDSGKVDPDARDEVGKTALLYAAEHGHEEVVKLLLDTRKVNLEARTRRDLWHATPLWLAKMGGHEAVVKLLQRRP